MCPLAVRVACVLREVLGWGAIVLVVVPEFWFLFAESWYRKIQFNFLPSDACDLDFVG
jgi:hypothetical protein